MKFVVGKLKEVMLALMENKFGGEFISSFSSYSNFTISFLTKKLSETEGAKIGVEEVMKFVVEKSKETILAMKDFGGDALVWFDKTFPPETRADKFCHWLHMAAPFLVAAVALPFIFCLFRCIFGLVFSMLCRIFGFIFSILRCIFGLLFSMLCCIFGFIFFIPRCCCVGIFRLIRFYCCLFFGRGKMMKAPGRGGAKMHRRAFEGNPKAYFTNLRASR